MISENEKTIQRLIIKFILLFYELKDKNKRLFE